MRWIGRLANFLQSRKLSADLDEEIQFHMDARIRDNEAAGMTQAEARRDAILRFGNRTAIQERTRSVDISVWLETGLQDLRYAARALRRNAGLTIVAVLSLALGIGSNTAIFSLIDAVLWKSLPVAQPEQLYVIQPAGRKGDGGAFSYAGFEALRDRNQVFSDTFTFAGGRWNVIWNGQAELANVELVSGNYFDALGIGPIAGRLITATDDKPSAAAVAVISHAYWKRRFALDASVLGAAISINGVPFTVGGVAPPQFFGVSVGYAGDLGFHGDAAASQSRRVHARCGHVVAAGHGASETGHQ